MNVNKICAAVSALCFAGTAVLLSMNNKNNNTASALERLLGDVNGNGVVDAVDASTILSYYAYVSAGHEDITLEQFMKIQNSNTTETTTIPQTTENKPSDNIKLKSGGDTFTIAVWNADDIPRLASTWLNVKEEDVYSSGKRQASKTLKTPSGASLQIINFGVGGIDAPEQYDSLFKSGEDLDVYYCEDDWISSFIENNERTAPLSDLGFTDEDFAQTYDYADGIGHNSSGVRKAAAPFISPGGFAYRTDLAQKYLGINSPTEMQKAVGTWDDFATTAKKLAEKQSGLALADSVGGIYQAYNTSHNMTDSDGKITESAKEFADYAKSLWECGGVTHNYQWTDEWTADGTNDKVMGYFVPTWAISGFLETAAENSMGKWDIVPGPESFYWGGMWTVVNPATDNADDCASFIRNSCLSTDSMLKAAKTAKYYIPNSKAAMSEILADPTLSGMSGNKVFNSNSYFGVFSTVAENILTYPVNYPNQRYRESCMATTIMEDYLKRGWSWEDTVTGCETSRYWDEIK